MRITFAVAGGGDNCPFSGGYLATRASEISEYLTSIFPNIKFNIFLINNKIFIEKNDITDILVLLLFPQAYRLGLTVADLFKSVKPDTFVIIGGPIGRAIGKELLRDSDHIDAVIIRDEEPALRDLIKFIRGKSIVPANTILKDGREGPVEIFNPYQEKSFFILGDRVHVALSRGCSYRCIYCPFTYYIKRWIIKDPVKIAKKLATYRDSFDEIILEDSLSDPKIVILFLKTLKELGVIYRRVVCNVRPEWLSEKTIAELSSLGCSMVTIGVETCSRTVQRIIGKNLNFNILKKVSYLLRKYKIGFKLNFIIGLPGQDRKDIEKCVKLIRDLRPNSIGVHKLIPYPGTPLYEKADLFKIRFWPKRWWKAGFRPFVETDRLNWKDIQVLANFLEVEGKKIGAIISKQY